MAHTLLYTMGYNAPEGRAAARGLRLEGPGRSSTRRSTKMTDALRPWTIDFHVAQNDGTVKGMGYHDKTGRHCMVTDPNGRLDITKHAGYLAARQGWRAHQGLPAHLLGRLHVPQ